MERAASTKSLSFSARMLDLTSRAKIGTFSMAIANAMVFSPGPRNSTMVMVSSRPGRDRTMSTTRIIQKSSQPPTKPLIAP